MAVENFEAGEDRPRTNLDMLEDARRSRYGWSWIGALATKTPQEGLTLHRTPKKKFQLPPPQRPKTTDIGNPLRWLGDSWREHRDTNHERKVVGSAERIMRREYRIMRLEAMSPGLSVAAAALGAPMLAPGIWKAAADAKTLHPVDDPNPFVSKANERRVVKAANRVVKDAGYRVQGEVFADARNIVHEVESAVPKVLVQQLEQIYQDPRP